VLVNGKDFEMSRIHDAFLLTLRIEHGEPPLTFNWKKLVEIIKSETPVCTATFTNTEPIEEKSNRKVSQRKNNTRRTSGS